MKNIAVVFCCSLSVLMSACAVQSDSSSLVENFVESTESSEISESKITNIKTTTQPLSDLNLKGVEGWSFNNRDKIIFLREKGYHYYFEKHKGDGPYRALAFDSGDGKYVEQPITDDFYANFFYGDVLYGYDKNLGIFKYGNEQTIFLNVKTYHFYYMQDVIYFSGIDEPAIYRMDYEGENISLVVKVEEYNAELQGFVVCDGKIWYECISREAPGIPPTNFAVYDLETKEILKFDNGGIGLINNGYMYYTDDDSKLYRLNLETYAIELICDAKIEMFDFSGDFILYATQDTLYKLNGKENKKILSANKLGKSDYFWNIQCQNDRIFVLGGSGAFYGYLAEIDINGQIIKKIHED
jgi:hypothetical protein